MSIAVVAEKPSVARDLARVLGATQRREGSLEGNGYIVTWAIGHLVALAEPHEMNPEWKRWRRDHLPILPAEWPLTVLEKTKGHFEIIRAILNSSGVERVICATDAGREGELIFRYIYEAARCRKPVQRLWISSLTDAAIREGLRRTRDSRELDGLAAAARGRSRADWLVGMNLSRAYGLAMDLPLSVGRVQTPTLAMIVERELAIRQFVPEDYLEVVATFLPRRADGSAAARDRPYQGTWSHPAAGGEKTGQQRRLPPDGVLAEQIVERARTGRAEIAEVSSETRRMPPPLLYDLSELQRHANRLYGFTAQRTLDIAQRLYETHKLLSYPRTDSRHLSKAIAETLSEVVAGISGPYQQQLAADTGQRPLGKRFVDDAKVSDHHAIIPTGHAARAGALAEDERKVFDLVCRRFLQAWHEDFVWASTTVITAIHSPGAVDRFHSSGTAIEQPGWKALDIGSNKKAPSARSDAAKDEGAQEEDEDEEQSLPPGLVPGLPAQALSARSVKKRTRPPPRLSDATLLTAMETAGRTLDEKELSEAMKESGLGTPATRAAIIETLLARDYAVRQGKALAATEKGIALIAAVDPEVKSPSMTGQWEARLQALQRGQGDLGSFMAGIEQYVRDVIARLPARLASGVASAMAARAPLAGSSLQTAAAPAMASRPLIQRTPTPPDGLRRLLKTAFGFDSFRAHQEAVCRAATAGADILLVMPTGAGKSLCYQLPGLARAGTTLVITPLIALMEDQVAKLQSRGLAAERIHSGRDRSASRQACRDYLDGKLDFLFIAPERLGVSGFPEMLAKRTPSLIAIDEAHCISQWGHDFRPDYRLLGQRLPLLRPAPVIAVTATATPIVQRDIVEQLGLGSTPKRFIHGFRRDNLAIEVLEVAKAARGALTRRLLADPARLPAIVYAPTRKQAEEVAAELSGEVSAAAYHAGLSSAARDKAQAAFLGGRLQVVVATIAFGMGIDKADVRTVIHLALPSSVEGYYQEIGRAGRDGREARAILMHSYADRHTHEFFLERDFPEPAELERLFARLTSAAVPRETLRKRLGMEEELFEVVLEKLWMHGGALVRPDEDVQRGRDGWQASYAQIRDQRKAQLGLIGQFAESHGCRMLHLIRHFGDEEDQGAPCGLCDVCAPERCIAAQLRPATTQEAAALTNLVQALQRSNGQSAGRLCREVLGEAPGDRRTFGLLVAALARAGLLRSADETFEKDGRTVTFQRVSLTPAGRSAAGDFAAKLKIQDDATGKRAAKSRRGKRAPPRAGRPRRAAAPAADSLEESLREWRLGLARKKRIPAFRILRDRALLAIADRRPLSLDELGEVPGIGQRFLKDFGTQVLAVCAKPALGASR